MSATAKRLLTRFNQGALSSIVITETAGASEFDPPTMSPVATTRQGVSRGVSSKFVDGENILSTDLQLMIEATSLTVDNRMTIDGKSVQILRVDQIPPSGVVVATRVFVRG